MIKELQTKAKEMSEYQQKLEKVRREETAYKGSFMIFKDENQRLHTAIIRNIDLRSRSICYTTESCYDYTVSFDHPSIVSIITKEDALKILKKEVIDKEG